MIFTPLTISGAFLVEPQPNADERGFFARTWCRHEFAQHGLMADLSQCSISFNTKRATLRGMHYQAPPHGEAKLVRASAGTIYDVALDLRFNSPSYGQWQALELSAQNPLSTVHSAGRRPRLFDAFGRRRGVLPDFRGSPSGIREGRALGRPGICQSSGRNRQKPFPTAMQAFRCGTAKFTSAFRPAPAGPRHDDQSRNSRTQGPRHWRGRLYRPALPAAVDTAF